MSKLALMHPLETLLTLGHFSLVQFAQYCNSAVNLQAHRSFVSIVSRWVIQTKESHRNVTL